MPDRNKFDDWIDLFVVGGIYLNLPLSKVGDVIVIGESRKLYENTAVAHMGHDGGVTTIANRARAAGASEEEIAETVGVAFLMGGLPALVTGSNAFKK